MKPASELFDISKLARTILDIRETPTPEPVGVLLSKVFEGGPTQKNVLDVILGWGITDAEVMPSLDPRTIWNQIHLKIARNVANKIRLELDQHLEQLGLEKISGIIEFRLDTEGLFGLYYLHSDEEVPQAGDLIINPMGDDSFAVEVCTEGPLGLTKGYVKAIELAFEHLDNMDYWNQEDFEVCLFVRQGQKLIKLEIEDAEDNAD